MSLPSFNFPPTIPLAQGIHYGNRGFSEPCQFPAPLTPPTQGLYAILVPDASSSPRPFRVLYFGETQNLMNRLTQQHEKFAEWKREAGGSTLYVAFHAMFGGTDQQRKDAERELINAYKPPCNVQMARIPTLKSLYGL